MLKFDYQIENFMTFCQVKQLRAKTVKAYEETLRIDLSNL